MSNGVPNKKELKDTAGEGLKIAAVLLLAKPILDNLASKVGGNTGTAVSGVVSGAIVGGPIGAFIASGGIMGLLKTIVPNGAAVSDATGGLIDY